MLDARADSCQICAILAKSARFSWHKWWFLLIILEHNFLRWCSHGAVVTLQGIAHNASYTYAIIHNITFPSIKHCDISVSQSCPMSVSCTRAIVIVTDKLKRARGQEDASIDKDGIELTPHAVISTIKSLSYAPWYTLAWLEPLRAEYKTAVTTGAVDSV